MSNRYREALTHLTYGVQDGGGFVLLTGEVGTGKTTVCRCLLQQLPDNTRLAFVLNPKLNSLELLATICDELKIEYPENCQSLKTLTDKLTEFLLTCYRDNLTVVVMIDEAQNLETEVLEQVRLLTNLETNQKKLLQVILVGQPELQEKLAKRELRQLAQRITARYHLRPLNLKETMAYILHRTRIAGANKSLFSRSAVELLHRKTQGIPRLINTICDRALLAAATRHRNNVEKKLMGLAIREIMGEEIVSHNDPSTARLLSSNWLKPALIGVGLLGLLGVAYWLGGMQQSSDNSKPQLISNPNQSSIYKSANNQLNDRAKNDADYQSKKGVIARPLQNETNSEIATDVTTNKSLPERIIGDQQWDSKGVASMGQLLSLWQVEYSVAKNGDACDFAGQFGLFCHTDIGNWQLLRDYNRPAILKFSAGLQGEFWALLKGLEGTHAILQVGSQESKIALGELSTIWSGQFKMIWQAPDGFNGDIKLGDQGDAVYWLSQSLIWLAESSDTPYNRFDVTLQNQLKTFQANKNIKADGIAGMQTILKINAELLVGIPLLTQNI